MTDHADNVRTWAVLAEIPNRQRMLDELYAAAAHIEELEAENLRLRRAEAVQWRDWQTVNLIDFEEGAS